MTTDTTVAVSSVIVALAALGVAVWQGIVSREHNRRSLTPHLGIHSLHQIGLLTVKCRNSGVGPAVVREFHVYVDDQVIAPGTDNPLIQALTVLELPITAACFTPSTGDFVAAGEDFNLLDVTEAEELLAPTIRSLSRVEIGVIYDNVYGERFESRDRLFPWAA